MWRRRRYAAAVAGMNYHDDYANGGAGVSGDVRILKKNDGDDNAVPDAVEVAVAAGTVGSAVAVADGSAVLELLLEAAEYYSAQSWDSELREL